MCQSIGCCRGSRTYICFTCRTTAKSLDAGQMTWNYNITNKTPQPNCPQCRKPMINCGFSPGIPTKHRDKLWKKLEEKYVQ